MKPSTMKTPALSTVYLDHERIGLMGDPRPPVAKIVAAAGLAIDVQVVRTRAPDDVHIGLQAVSGGAVRVGRGCAGDERRDRSSVSWQGAGATGQQRRHRGIRVTVALAE